MLDDPRNAVRPPLSRFYRTVAALICAAILLTAFAFGVKYFANNWREIVYGKPAAITVIGPEEGFPTVGNELSRTRGVMPWRDNADKLA
jgi:hypothetical protein